MIDENIDYKKWRKISKATVEKRNKFVTTFPINRNGRVIKCQLGYFWRPRWFQAGKEWSYELSLARTVLHWYSLWFVGKVSGFFFSRQKNKSTTFFLGSHFYRPMKWRHKMSKTLQWNHLSTFLYDRYECRPWQNAVDLFSAPIPEGQTYLLFRQDTAYPCHRSRYLT